MTFPGRTRICELLEKPLQLFAELYVCVEPDYGMISNEIYTSSQSKKRFDILSDYFAIQISSIYSAPLKRRLIDGITRTIMRESDDNVLCLSLLKAVAEYIVNRKGLLRRLKPLRVGDIFMTFTPPNPIYDALPNQIKDNIGTGIRDIEVFRRISVIKQETIKIAPIVNDLLDTTNDYLARLDGSFRIAVSPFMKDIKFNFGSLVKEWPVGEKTPFWFEQIANREAAEDYIVDKILSPCFEKGVNVLVLPELSIDKKMLAFLRQWLREKNRDQVWSGKGGILLLVAGSFHLSESSDKLYNISTVLNHAGEVIWQQKKMQRFSFDSNDLRKTPELKDLLKTSNEGGYENITVADTVSFADTRIGRLCVSICIDYFHDANIDVYSQSEANIFLIPAMTLSDNRFADIAKIRGNSNLASAFFANSGYIADEKKGLSFYYIPDKKLSFHYAEDGMQNLLIFDVGQIS